MKILKNIEIVDLALKYKDHLIFGDLHIGLEGTLKEQGLSFPLNQTDKVIKRLEKIIKKAKPKTIIINGDLKEEFGRITQTEWRDLDKFINFLKSKAGLIFIKGNHDVLLEPLARKFDVKVKNRLDIDNITILHGNAILPNLKKTIIIGHEHPAISFNERPDEKFKCFLLGKYKKHNLIVSPSFNLLVEGSDITREQFLSPFIKDLKNFEIFVIQDKVYKFGKLKDIQKL